MLDCDGPIRLEVGKIFNTTLARKIVARGLGEIVFFCDDGAPVTLPAMDLVSFQVTGTLGTDGSTQMEATNEGTPANWAIVGAAFTAAGMAYPADYAVVRNFRPRVMAGDGTTSFIANACFRLS